MTFDIDKIKSKIVKDITRIVNDMDAAIIESEVFDSHDVLGRCNYHLCLRTSTKDMKRLVNYIRAHSKVENFTHRVVKKSLS